MMTTVTKPTGNVSTKLVRYTGQSVAVWFKFMLLMGVIGFVLALGSRLLNHNNYTAGYKATYATEYGVASGHVIIFPKPHDCDWEHAPLGDKACHYEKHVELLDPIPGYYPHTEVYVTWRRVED
jgi:hypothetical protein